MQEERYLYCPACQKATRQKAESYKKGEVNLECLVCGKKRHIDYVRTIKCLGCQRLTPHAVGEVTIICLMCGADNTEATK